jgi:hypothetical protein
MLTSTPKPALRFQWLTLPDRGVALAAAAIPADRTPAQKPPGDPSQEPHPFTSSSVVADAATGIDFQEINNQSRLKTN